METNRMCTPSSRDGQIAAYTLRQARAAIARERETRHWMIPQWKDAAPDEHWPTYIATVRREADEAVDWIADALDTLRSAWNTHMDGCPVQGPTIEPPSEADLAAWRDAPSGTAGMSGQDRSAASIDYTCSACGERVSVGHAAAWPSQCPHCGTAPPTLLVRVGGRR